MGEADDLKAENARLQRELDDALSVAAVAECVKESMVELERQKNSVDEELATMRQLLNEAHDEASSARTSYEHQLAKAKAVVGQLEGENHELRVRAKLGHGGGAAGVSEASVIDKDTILGGAAVITDGAKSFARRMKSNLLPLGSSAQQQQQSAHQQQMQQHLAMQRQFLVDQINNTCDYMDMIIYTVLETLQEKVNFFKNIGFCQV